MWPTFYNIDVTLKAMTKPKVIHELKDHLILFAYLQNINDVSKNFDKINLSETDQTLYITKKLRVL